MHAYQLDQAAVWKPQTKPRHVLASSDLSGPQIRLILDTARDLKHQWKHDPKPIHPTEHRMLAMVFEKQSLRTRVSFETAFHELGGHAIYLTRADIDLGRREPVADAAGVLSRWASLIVARMDSHETIQELAQHATVPVINALTDEEHPCQALADLLTIEEHLGDGPLKIVWVGDGNNVANSLAVAASRLGHEMVICTPPGYEAAERAYHEGAEQIYLPHVAAHEADVIVTDTWVSMGQEAESAERLPRFAKYQVDASLMSHAKPTAIFLHCLPAHRGEEVAAEIIDGPQSVVFDEAENRMHVQKALMKLVLENAL